MSDTEAVDVVELDEDGVRELIDNALKQADTTWEDLQKQAEAGRFDNAKAKTTWFVVSSFA